MSTENNYCACLRFAVGAFTLLVGRQKGVGLVVCRNDIRPRPHAEALSSVQFIALGMFFTEVIFFFLSRRRYSQLCFRHAMPGDSVDGDYWRIFMPQQKFYSMTDGWRCITRSALESSSLCFYGLL